MKQEDLFIYHALSQKDIRFYEQNGYLKVGHTLTSAGVKEMLEQCMKVWRAEKGDFSPENTWLQNALLVNIHHHAPVVKEFYFNGPLVDIAKQLIGPNIKGATSQLTFKMRGNTQSFDWHQDNGYGQLDPYNTISTLTALEDVDEETGCLRILPGSQKYGQIEVTRGYDAKAKAKQAIITTDVDETAAIAIPMKAGETLLFHCWTLHQSRGNFSPTRDRRILFLRYADADAVETYNDRKPRLGRLLRGKTRFPEVEAFEADL